jgi:hypothetical protein
MDRGIESLVKRAQHPRLIPGIYNYCHRWCERCPFTDRCLTFENGREYETAHPEAGVFEHVHDSFQQAFALLEAWCEREGIDFDKIRSDANSDAVTAELRRADAAVNSDPLQKLATAYTRASVEVVKSLEKASPFHAWDPAVRDSIDTIAWYSGMVSAKIHRALHGRLDREGDGIEWDEVQNDWNGSAKVARLAIAESRLAWEALLTAGDVAQDSPLRKVLDLLDRVDSGTAERFPQAMEFIRPGFDEPDVAAGALTSLACFEPRRRP